MGQVLHGCATTTEAVRRAIQNSQESLRALAKRYGINQKTVAKWKQRKIVADLPTGPMFSPGIFWSGLSLNRSGWEVQDLRPEIRCCASPMPPIINNSSNAPSFSLASGSSFNFTNSSTAGNGESRHRYAYAIGRRHLYRPDHHHRRRHQPHRLAGIACYRGAGRDPGQQFGKCSND